jgi:hypothetical protein
MTPEKEEKLNSHIEAIAKILYEETNSEDLVTLEKIEEVVRKKTLEYVTPQIGFFLSKKPQGQARVESEKSKVF